MCAPRACARLAGNVRVSECEMGTKSGPLDRGPHAPSVFGRCLLGFRPRTVNGDAMNGSNHSMAMGAVTATALCSVAAHMALLFWWSRRKHDDAQHKHSEEEWTEPPPAYAVLGESVPPERVLAMQSEAGDVDQTTLASEDSSLATGPPPPCTHSTRC